VEAADGKHAAHNSPVAAQHARICNGAPGDAEAAIHQRAAVLVQHVGSHEAAVRVEQSGGESADDVGSRADGYAGSTDHEPAAASVVGISQQELCREWEQQVEWIHAALDEELGRTQQQRWQQIDISGTIVFLEIVVVQQEVQRIVLEEQLVQKRLGQSQIQPLTFESAGSVTKRPISPPRWGAFFIVR